MKVDCIWSMAGFRLSATVPTSIIAEVRSLGLRDFPFLSNAKQIAISCIPNQETNTYLQQNFLEPRRISPAVGGYPHAIENIHVLRSGRSFGTYIRRAKMAASSSFQESTTVQDSHSSIATTTSLQCLAPCVSTMIPSSSSIVSLKTHSWLVAILRAL